MKNRSQFFWRYSIALFSVALLLIGFSAFTGVRYQENKNEAYQMYKGAQASVTQLQNQLEQLKAENNTLKGRVEMLSLDAARTKTLEDTVAALQLLSKAQRLSDLSDFEGAKAVLNSIDVSLLSADALSLYDSIKSTLD